MKCKEQVWVAIGRWGHYRPCSRDVKAEGLCWLHLSAKQRQKRRDAESARADKEESERLQKAKAACTGLRAEYGLEAEPYYTPGRGSRLGFYTGKVIIDPEALLELLKKPRL